MLKDKKILVTGPAGKIAYPLTRDLARRNEVWGISRFGDPRERRKVDELGVTTRQVDLGSGDFGDLPDNFDYVLHIGAHIAPDLDYDRAIRVNAEGTGLLMTHCRKAKAILVMSTTGVYQPNPDPLHAFLETDPLGDGRVPGVPAYAISKLAQEAVARMCARQLNVPTIIARMNCAYGPTGRGGLPAMHCDAILAGRQVVLRWDPNTYSPIHESDIFEQTEPLLEAAATPCPIVNWGGDEVVSAQDWCRYFGEIAGVAPDIAVREIPGSQRGVVADVARRKAITGPCRVSWRDGMREVAEARMRAAAQGVGA